MARKIRLNQGHRAMLRERAEETVKILLGALGQKRDKALAVLKEEALREFHKNYPEADMKILAKYNEAGLSNKLRVSPDGRSDQKELVYKESFLQQDRYAGTLLVVKSKALDNYRRLRDEHAKQFNERLKPYQRLINSAVYYEDVMENWEGAKGVPVLANSCTALLCITKSDLDRIAADQEELLHVEAMPLQEKEEES